MIASQDLKLSCHLCHHEECGSLGDDSAGENDGEGDCDGDQLQGHAGLLDEVGVLLRGRGGLVFCGLEFVPFFHLV